MFIYNNISSLRRLHRTPSRSFGVPTLGGLPTRRHGGPRQQARPPGQIGFSPRPRAGEPLRRDRRLAGAPNDNAEFDGSGGRHLYSGIIGLSEREKRCRNASRFISDRLDGRRSPAAHNGLLDSLAAVREDAVRPSAAVSAGRCRTPAAVPSPSSRAGR